MIKMWDLKCSVCGAELIDEFVEDEQYPGCPQCESETMYRVPGGLYHESMVDRRRRKRNPNTDFTPDALTVDAIREGQNRRKARLGGTGMM